MSENAVKWQIYTAANPTVERIIPELAAEIGLNESIVLMQIAYWISISNNVRDSAYWTYQTLGDMRENAFPYWDIQTIRRALHSLRDSGYILIGNYNKRKGDNTQWFALEPDKLSSLKSIIVGHANKASTPYQVDSTPYQVDSTPYQNETTLPENTPENTQKKKDNARKRAGSSHFYPSNRKTWTRAHLERYADENPVIHSMCAAIDKLYSDFKSLPSRYVALDAIELYETLKHNDLLQTQDIQSLKTYASEHIKTDAGCIYRRMLYALPNWLECRASVKPAAKPIDPRYDLTVQQPVIPIMIQRKRGVYHE